MTQETRRKIRPVLWAIAGAGVGLIIIGLLTLVVSASSQIGALTDTNRALVGEVADLRERLAEQERQAKLRSARAAEDRDALARQIRALTRLLRANGIDVPASEAAFMTSPEPESTPSSPGRTATPRPDTAPAETAPREQRPTRPAPQPARPAPQPAPAPAPAPAEPDQGIVDDLLDLILG